MTIATRHAFLSFTVSCQLGTPTRSLPDYVNSPRPTCTHKHTHAGTHAHMYADTHACMHTCTHTHTHTITYTCMHACTHTHSHMHTCTHAHNNIHSHTHTHTTHSSSSRSMHIPSYYYYRDIVVVYHSYITVYLYCLMACLRCWHNYVSCIYCHNIAMWSVLATCCSPYNC